MASPLIVQKRPLAWLGSAPGRSRARPVQGEPAATQLRTALEPLLKIDAAPEAEIVLLQSAPLLSAEARAEAGQRIAWSYYQLGRDADARRVADAWRSGASGDWAAHSAWISGLASWRQGDCEAASRAFREVAAISRERELGAGGYYWAARAEQACRRPRSVAPLLKAAARSNESSTLMPARLGLDTACLRPCTSSSLVRTCQFRRRLSGRHLGAGWPCHACHRRDRRPSEHNGLLEFASGSISPAPVLGRHNGHRGGCRPPRPLPVPRWARSPFGCRSGLSFAHIIQKSTFRANAVTPPTRSADAFRRSPPGHARARNRLLRPPDRSRLPPRFGELIAMRGHRPPAANCRG